MEKVYAIISNGIVENVVVADTDKWNPEDKTLVELDLATSPQVVPGWAHSDTTGFTNPHPAVAAPVTLQETPVAAALVETPNAAMWNQVELEQAIGAALVKFGVLKDDPTKIKVTTL